MQVDLVIVSQVGVGGRCQKEVSPIKQKLVFFEEFLVMNFERVVIVSWILRVSTDVR